jgi:hypothetical protein
MQGAVIVEVGGVGLEAARAALARAVASGALGAGYAVRRDGDAIVLDGPRGDGADGGRLVLGDGRLAFELSLAGAERRRAGEGVLLAALVSVVAVIAWSWMFYVSLPTGGAVGVAWAASQIVADRRRVRRRVVALASSLPVLLAGDR